MNRRPVLPRAVDQAVNRFNSIYTRVCHRVIDFFLLTAAAYAKSPPSPPQARQRSPCISRQNELRETPGQAGKQGKGGRGTTYKKKSDLLLTCVSDVPACRVNVNAPQKWYRVVLGAELSLFPRYCILELHPAASDRSRPAWLELVEFWRRGGGGGVVEKQRVSRSN